MKCLKTEWIKVSALFFLASCTAFAEPRTAVAQIPQFKYADLGVIGTDPGYGSLPIIINNHDEIIITTDDGKSTPTSFLISGMQKKDLSKAPGIDQSKCKFVAITMNDKEEVLGEGYSREDEKSHALLYQDGQIQEIVPLQPAARKDDNTSYIGINNQGQMIGDTTLFNRDSSGHAHGFLYENGEMKDLLSITLVQAINAKGQIAGLVYDESGELTAAIPDCGRQQ